MKITRNQLRRIIKEEIELEEDATEILTTSVAQHIQVLLDKAWPKAEFVPDSPTVNADMPNANRFVLTYTFRPSIPNLKAITNKFNSNIAPKTGFKSTPLDNRGNKIFKMGLANENPVTWDGNNKKSAGGYVKLRIRVTLMDKFMATAKADPSIITSGDTETLSISENKMKITRRQLRQIIKEELNLVNERSPHAFTRMPPPGWPGKTITAHFEFERSKDLGSDSMIKIVAQDGSPLDWYRYMSKALANERPGYKPIKIKAGASGTGTPAQNDIVMKKRIDSALEYLQQFMGKSKSGLEFDPDSIDNKASIEPVYNKVEPGQRIELPPGSGVYVVVPADPDDDFFVQSQYVKISIADPGDKPIYTTLADAFIEATLRSRMPTYSALETKTMLTLSPGSAVSALSAKTGKARIEWSDRIYKILDQLRDGNDFDKFNDKVKELAGGMDFYKIACRHMLTMPKKIMGISIPAWMGPGAGIGPKEIGEDVAAINLLLKDRFDRDPIKCPV